MLVFINGKKHGSGTNINVTATNSFNYSYKYNEYGDHIVGRSLCSRRCLKYIWYLESLGEFFEPGKYCNWFI